jgi:hypothetical protein
MLYAFLCIINVVAMVDTKLSEIQFLYKHTLFSALLILYLKICVVYT